MTHNTALIAKLQAEIQDVRLANRPATNIKDKAAQAKFNRQQAESIDKVVSEIQARIEVLKSQAEPEAQIVPLNPQEQERQISLMSLAMIGGIIFLVS